MHRHRPKHRDTRAFGYCVAPGRCHPASHGNVVEIQTCSCGAERRVNINQGFRERGSWQEPLGR